MTSLSQRIIRLGKNDFQEQLKNNTVILIDIRTTPELV